MELLVIFLAIFLLSQGDWEGRRERQQRRLQADYDRHQELLRCEVCQSELGTCRTIPIDLAPKCPCEYPGGRPE